MVYLSILDRNMIAQHTHDTPHTHTPTHHIPPTPTHISLRVSQFSEWMVSEYMCRPLRYMVWKGILHETTYQWHGSSSFPFTFIFEGPPAQSKVRLKEFILFSKEQAILHAPTCGWQRLLHIRTWLDLLPIFGNLWCYRKLNITELIKFARMDNLSGVRILHCQEEIQCTP